MILRNYSSIVIEGTAVIMFNNDLHIVDDSFKIIKVEGVHEFGSLHNKKVRVTIEVLND